MKDILYKRLLKLEQQKKDLKKEFWISDFQKILLDHRFHSQIELLKELLKGDIRKLRKKHGSALPTLDIFDED